MEMLGACDRALQACSASLGSCNELVNEQRQIIRNQAVDIASLRDANSGILNSPAFWLIVGVATGAIVVGIAK